MVVRDGAESAYDETACWFRHRQASACGGRRATTRSDLKVRDGFLLVVLVWALLPVFACLPLILQLQLSFTDAYFEAMSGLTTTGATVLSGLDTLPPSINLWRGMLVWLGGMGLIVLAVAVLPLLGIGGRQMFKAETPGPMKDSKLTPRMAETAKGLWVVYGVILTVLCILACRWAGMSWFDAVMHSFTTMGLGGFSSHDASFGHWNSPADRGVTVGFHADRRDELRHACSSPCAVAACCPTGTTRRPAGFLGVTLGSVLGIAIYLEVQGVYPGLRHGVPPCRLQRGVDRHHHRLRQRRLQPVADLRAAVDAVPVQLRHQRRLHRRRHQDDARHHPLQAGVSAN
jgi:trk system potassium uptake protein TrkH